ncbi:hypothetical protein MPSEU_000825900 [Mayamaea pseudoterrestris]|nr:hypothetical protein MPSEU_000825900 [Mayamaea pseudoterrestris]
MAADSITIITMAMSSLSTLLRPLARHSLAIPCVTSLAASTNRSELVQAAATSFCSTRSFSSSSVLTSDTSITTPKPQDLTTKTSKDGVTGRPIDFDIAAKIEGSESQILTVRLEPNQVLRAESGAMMFMTDGIDMNTTTGGGLSSGFQRMLTGQHFFVSDYTYSGDSHGYVALGTDFPSKILRLNVDEHGKIVCQKGALLCASHTIDIAMEFTKKFSTGFFGGEGFILQALTGEGDVFVKAGGSLIRRDLKEGETLRVSSGCLVAFVNAEFDVQMVKGFANVFAGGEGLFFTTFTGPGTVWLQGQPPDRMISEIARRVPSGGVGFGVPVGGGGDNGGGGGEDQGGSSEGSK